MALPAKVGSAVPIVMILEDGVQTQYPQAEIYAGGGTVPVVTLDLLHKAKGRYEGSWTPTATGVYTAHFIVYSDAGHTIESIAYTREAEQLIVTENDADDLALMMVRVLGLVHENVFIDNTVHDLDGQLVAARVRVFDSKANVELATDGGSETTGLVATYEMNTVYESQGLMGTYRMKRIV
jgi:hypothetical protein